MKKLTQEDLVKLNKQTQQYFYKGYTVHFMHGWFCAYLAAPSDSEEDLVIPTYLILDEAKISNERAFAQFIDDLMLLYSEIADNIFEHNKLIKPLVNLTNRNSFPIDALTTDEKLNLQQWLYGYLCGHLVIGNDITEYCDDEKLLDEKFFPALFTVCSAFLLLDKEVEINSTLAATALDDYEEVKADLIEMWEVAEGQTILDQLVQASLTNILADLVAALNTLFSVVRTVDEARFSGNMQHHNLLNKLYQNSN
jgi:hypothetical protein